MESQLERRRTVVQNLEPLDIALVETIDAKSAILDLLLRLIRPSTVLVLNLNLLDLLFDLRTGEGRFSYWKEE